MKYHLDVVGGSVLSVSAAQPPSVFWTVAVKVRVLGSVHVVNFHVEPGDESLRQQRWRFVDDIDGKRRPHPYLRYRRRR